MKVSDTRGGGSNLEVAAAGARLGARRGGQRAPREPNPRGRPPRTPWRFGAPSRLVSRCQQHRRVIEAPDGWLQIGTLLYLHAEESDKQPVPHDGREVLTYYDMNGSKESWAAPEDDIRIIFDGETHEWAVFVRDSSPTADELRSLDEISRQNDSLVLRRHRTLHAPPQPGTESPSRTDVRTGMGCSPGDDRRASVGWGSQLRSSN